MLFQTHELPEVLIRCTQFSKNRKRRSPFSLFREYVAWLMAGEVKFSTIGNVNAITYKEVFPLIRDNRMWLGASMSNAVAEFRVPDSYPLTGSKTRSDDDGRKYISVPGVAWFTNIEHGRRHEPLSLMTLDENKRFSKHKQIKGSGYQKYDNYDAIEVPFTDAIPSDYDGVMGVLITFLAKYNPDQFELVRFRHGDDDKDLRLPSGKAPYFRILIRKKETE